MANPQTEAGHVRLANDLFEALFAFEFSERELKVLLAIIRLTYGWKRKSAPMGLQQLSDMTGIAKPHVSRVMKNLERRRVIVRYSEPSFKQKARYGIRKDWDKWQVTLSGERPSPKPTKKTKKATVTDLETVTDSVTDTEEVIVTESVRQQLPNRSSNSYRIGNDHPPSKPVHEGIVEAPKTRLKTRSKTRHAADGDFSVLEAIALNAYPSGLSPEKRDQILGLARQPEPLDVKKKCLQEGLEEAWRVKAERAASGKPIKSFWAFFIHCANERLLAHRAKSKPQTDAERWRFCGGRDPHDPSLYEGDSVV